MHAWIQKSPSPPRKLAEELIIIDDVITFETEMQLLDLLSKIDNWQDLIGKWGTLEKRRYGWGDSPIDKRNMSTIPPLIEKIGNELNIRFRALVPNLPHNFTSCTANRYPIGEGLGKHKDGGVWEPYVVGLTIGSSRHMEFYCEDKRLESLHIQTKRCSAYIFWGNMYTDYYHASLKGAKNGKYFQEGTAYSLTYRHVSKTIPNNSYEDRQSRLYSLSGKRLLEP
tara:strand:- start:168 stop:842 length:675 start_codon:yes stop_codon:yes gene_type:complete